MAHSRFLISSGLLLSLAVSAAAFAQSSSADTTRAEIPRVGAAAADAARVGTTQQPAIYGNDDRKELMSNDVSATADTARLSAVALVSGYQLKQGVRATIGFRPGVKLQAATNLCPTEAFAEQPTHAFCSGVLIGPDLLLTAGHCVWDAENQCPSLRFVFNYMVENETSSTVVPLEYEEVYACQKVVTRQQSAGTDGLRDWAVVQLDRPVSTPFVPAAVRRDAAPMAVGTRLTMIGSPSGLPLKIDEGGRVRDSRAKLLDVFVANVDAFGGNSGSGVWDQSTGLLAGILVSGDTDYVMDGNCRRVNRCTESGCSGENVVYMHRILADLCSVITSETLCNTRPRAGDGFCAYNETGADCNTPPADDALCTALQPNSDTCFYTIPTEWSCLTSRYGAYDGCDKNCGAPDPDCNIVSADAGLNDLFNCQSGSTAAARGGLLASLLVLVGLAWWQRRRRSQVS